MVVAWQNGENTGAAFNPLATTQTAPGATCWNKLPSMPCGVKNYTSREQGLQATVETLTNGFYPNILAGLQTNNPAQVLNDGELATWGTGRGLVEQQYQLQLALLAQPLQNTQPTTSGEKCPVTQPEMHINAHFSDTNSGYWAGQIGGMHNGVDIGGTPGQPVYAPFTMTIEDIQYYGDAGRIGWYVQSRLGDGYLFYAGHLGTTTVQVGQHVAACTQIGTIGEVFHVHVKIAPPEAPVPCEPYARPDGHPWCEDFLSYYDAH
jgi:murein DD-endopeptidase MepM/ murein hydrolase activator NlpD